MLVTVSFRSSEEHTEVTVLLRSLSFRHHQRYLFWSKTSKLSQTHSASVELLLHWIKVILAAMSGAVQVNVKTVLTSNSVPTNKSAGPVYLSVTGQSSPPSLLDTHILLPPGLGEHLHLISCAADLPLPPHSPVRVTQPHGDGCVKHLLQILLCQRRALDVRHSPDFFRQGSGILLRHGPLPPPRQLDEHFDVLPQVALRAHQEDGRERAAAADFRDPLLPDVLKGGWADHTEAEQQGVGAAVAEVAEFVKLVLVM